MLQLQSIRLKNEFLKQKRRDNNKEQIVLLLHAKGIMLQMFLMSAVVESDDVWPTQPNNKTHGIILSCLKWCKNA